MVNSEMHCKTDEIWPNFFIVGAAKAGTTSLYEYLKQHPQVYMCPIKEPRFFTQMRYSIELEKYINSERITDETAYLRLFRDSENAKARGEASPDYLMDQATPYCIKEKVPTAKIIILLRDPIERAYSHYLHFVRAGVETAPFYEALFAKYAHSYIELGNYYEQVKRYLEVFGPDQVLVLLFEDLKRNPSEFVGRALNFLEVEPELGSAIAIDKQHNPYLAPKNSLAQHILGRTLWLRYALRGIIPKGVRSFIYHELLLKKATKPAIDPKAVEFLKTKYQAEITELEKLLGMSLPDLRRTW